MFGIRYYKAAPTTYVLQYSGSRVKREGLGLSFFYFSPWTTLVAVPVGSTDVAFIFSETTADFQEVTIQGHLTFRVKDGRKLSTLLDYSIRPNGQYVSEDPQKLSSRISQAAQTATRSEIQSKTLRSILLESDGIVTRVQNNLANSLTLANLGVELLSFGILAIKPVPETARALEAEAREKLLREADDAIYLRRNNAVEQERRIRENELATEVAVQAKQREIEETKLAAQISLEDRRKELVTTEAQNSKTRADAQAYAVKATLEPLTSLDPKALQVLASANVDPRLMVAMAFQEIASNASKVGTLNITPDLLDSLMEKKRK
jgi:hypothetical protein